MATPIDPEKPYILGRSAGRSAGNRTGEGARRRNTPRERAAVEPPLDQIHLLDESEGPRTYRLTPRGERVLVLADVAILLGGLALLVFILGTWFGLWLA